MANKYEDFERFLKANYNNDWLRFTSSDAKEDTKNTIFANHQKGFNIYKRLSETGMLKNDYIPPEVLSGQLTVEEFFFRMQEYAGQNLVYDDGLITAVRMQYAENLPNMVYTEDPIKQILLKSEHAKEIGLKGETYNRHIQGFADGYQVLAKAETLGIPKEQAKFILKKSNSIDSIMQLFEAQKRIDKAKTTEDKQTAKEQYDILYKEQQEALEKHSKDILDLLDKAIEIKKAENIDDKPKDKADDNAPKTADDKPKDQTDDKHSFGIIDEYEAKYGIKYEDDEAYKSPLHSMPQRTSKPKSFTLSEPNDHTETKPLEERKTSRSFNNIFASYIKTAEDLSSSGIAQALAQNYSFEELYEFRQYAMDILPENIHNRVEEELKRARSALTQNKMPNLPSIAQLTQPTTSSRRTSSTTSGFSKDTDLGI